jgi:hypothetical protein
VAEATQKENLEMKLISEEMKTLAISALRENSSMRFLQVITMLFLPATFVAVSHVQFLFLFFKHLPTLESILTA